MIDINGIFDESESLASHAVRLEAVANSDYYRELERQVQINNARFRDLSPKVRLVALYLISIGREALIGDLWRLFYRRRVPTIEEFLSEKYLGAMSKMIYPQWRKELLDTFSLGSQRNELILSGAIGTGKTTIARVAHYYNLVRVTSLRYPQLTLGATPDTLLVLSLFSVTLEKASLSVMKPFIALLEKSPLFEAVSANTEFPEFKNSGITPYVDNKNYVDLPNGIMIYSGSTVSHALSFSLFGCLLDEAEFRRSGIEEAFDTYANLKERVRSRFLGSRYILLTLVSSAKSTTGVITRYTQNLKKDDPYVKLLSYPIWEVKSFDAYAKGYFYVLHGTKTHPSRLLDTKEFHEYEAGIFHIPPNCEVIKTPEVYRPDFETDLERALRNLAGVQTEEGNHLFDDLEHMEYKFLLPEFRVEAPLRGRIPLVDKLPSGLIQLIPGGKRLARYPLAPRYVHLDMAEVSEAGLAMVHKELKQVGEVTEVVYVVDFVCYIVSPDRISFDKVEQLLIDLSEILEIDVEVLSTDQYQSASMRQKLVLEKGAKKVKITSVDRDIKPYMQLSQVIAHQNFAIGRCPKVKGQLGELREENGKIITKMRKDMTDALAGAVHNAAMNVADFPTYPFLEESQKAKDIDKEKWESV